MKVMFTIDTLGTSGTERSTLNIIKNMSPDIQVVVVYFYPRCVLRDDFESTGATVYAVGLRQDTSWIRGISPLVKILRREKPDVVVSSILRSNLISRVSCFLTRTKLIGTFVSDSYNSLRISNLSARQKFLFYFYYLLDRITSGVPVYWISNSAYIKASNCKKLNITPGIVDVVYRSRNVSLFPPKSNITGPGPFRFVYLGRLLQTKGIGELVQAFAILEKEYPNITLDLFGEGIYRSTIEGLIIKFNLSDKIIVHGRVPDGWNKLYDYDCLVFPSWYEGFSGTLVESMMVGIPIIASDIPMNMEAVSHNVTGLLFKVKDVSSLLDQMKFVINRYSYVAQLARTARDEAFSRFSNEQILKQYEGILRRVANNEI